jgi:NAD(P)-dependent dehydrogenase (short-subunit alcohol dehydrogenase family)
MDLKVRDGLASVTGSTEGIGLAIATLWLPRAHE